MQHGRLPPRPIVIGLAVLYVASLLINLGMVPLYLEETRRAFITLEMLIRGDWVVATEFGDLYCRKPPLFNWAMIPFFKVFGITEWTPRMMTVLSLLGMGALNWAFVRRHATPQLAFWSTALFLIGGDLYFSYSTVGEIDVFYALITYASMIAVFHFDRGQRHWALFISLYALSALGFLTKGLPSVLFPVITIGVWYGVQGRWKSLFSWPHLAGLCVFVMITGAFFWAYAQRAPLDGYIRDLWSQSSERTVAGTGIAPLFKHLVVFTLDTLLNILPASLLLPFLFRKGAVDDVRRDPFLLFCATALIVNAAVYWLSPGSHSRYIYMLFPLMAVLLAQAWLAVTDQPDVRQWCLRWTLTMSMTILGVLVACFPWTVFGEDLEGGRWIVCVVGVGLLLLGWIQHRRENWRMTSVVAALILARIGFDLVVLPLRATTGGIPREKEDAMQIASLVGDQPLHLYDIGGEGGVSFTTVFYLERERWQVLDRTKPGGENGSDHYIAQRVSISGRAIEELYAWQWKSVDFALVRFLDRPPASQMDKPTEP